MSLPTPPSGILDRDQPWYRGKIGDAQWDRVKAKLTGGTDAGGTSYSKLIDCSPGEADKIISNMKKDPRGYPQMYMPGGGESYQVMIDYYQFLKDAYLFDEPKPEPEEIPVQVEVVEVEQKTVDEPIVIKIEAPFESTPEVKLSAPKRISVPRRSGVISTATKKSTAERMADAFTNNLLDPLVDSIQNPPAPAPQRQRKQKETLIKIKKNVKASSSYKGTKGPGFFQNSSLFLFNKTKDAFGRAAELRKQATEQGMPEQDPVFYLKKALGNELGGDAIARTRGTFSSNPDATLDPALTKQQRLSSGIFGTRTIRKPKESRVATDIERQVKELEKKFNEVIDTKKITPESSELDKTLKDLKDRLSTGNKLQKGINDSKKKLLGLEAKAADAAQARAEADEIKKGKDLSDFETVDKLTGKKKGGKRGNGRGNGGFGRMFRNLRKWLRRVKNPKKTFQAIKRLTKQKLKKIPGVKQVNNFMKNKKPLQGLRNMFGGNKAKNAAKVADTASDASGLGSRFSGLGSRFSGLGSRFSGLGGKFNGALGGLRGLARSPLGRFGGRAMIGIGTLAGIDATRTRFANMNDPEYQKMVQAKRDRGEILTNEEQYSNMFGVATGAASSIPALGLPVIAGEMLGNSKMLQQRGIDMQEERKNRVNNVLDGIGISSNKDRYRSSGWDGTGENPVQILQGRDNRNIFQKMGDGYNNFISGTEKMSEGGVIGASGGVPAMIGEAGPEMLIRAGQSAASSVNPLQSLAPIIVAMREVTKRAGTWADPVENMVRQITDPIAKSLNLPVVPMNVDIDSPPDDSKMKKTKSGGLLGKIMNFLKGGGGDEGEDADVVDDGEDGVDPGTAGNFPAGAKGVLDLIASVEAPNYDAFNQSGGRTEGKATEKTIQWLQDNAQGAIGRYQHMPMYIMDRALAAGYTANTLFTPAVQDAVTIKQMETEHGLKEFLAGTLSAEKFAARLAPTWRGLPQGPAHAARLGGTKDSTYNDAHAGRNAAGKLTWADTLASLESIRGGGNSSPRRAASNVSIVGDSVAQGFVLSGANRGGRNDAVQGRNPQQVEAVLKSKFKKGSTDHVVLSTGLSNNVSMMSDVKDQMAYLKSQDIPFTVIPLASGVSNSANLNKQLKTMAPRYGGTYADQVEGFTMKNDGYNAHMANPGREFSKLRIARLSGS